MLEVTRRTIACWKLQEERWRVGSYKKNDSVLEIPSRIMACGSSGRMMNAYSIYKKNADERTLSLPPPPPPTPTVPEDRKPVSLGTPKTLILRARFSVRWHKHNMIQNIKPYLIVITLSWLTYLILILCKYRDKISCSSH